MRRVLVFLCGVALLLALPRAAAADQCPIRPIYSEVGLSELRSLTSQPCSTSKTGMPVPAGQVVGSGIIYLYPNDEARYSSLNNVLNAVDQLEGKYIYPGEIFSFNQAANLLQDTIPYDLGPDVADNLVRAGGVCMVSTLLATAAHDAGLPFINERGKPIDKPIPHSRFYRYYHQVNQVGDHMVPIVEAAVAIEKTDTDSAWKSVLDMQFINTTGHILVLHFQPSFTVGDLDLNQPFGLIQKQESINVELIALPTGLDSLLAPGAAN